MPHSHNDPGWIKTFEQYYQTQTKQILDNMVLKLNEHPDMKFIWAEISFLALWWAEQDHPTQENVRNLVKRGQLEIVTGGWVMNDEANSFYFAMVEQLILGHEWLHLNLKYKPNNGWAIGNVQNSLHDIFVHQMANFYLPEKNHEKKIVKLCLY